MNDFTQIMIRLHDGERDPGTVPRPRMPNAVDMARRRARCRTAVMLEITEYVARRPELGDIALALLYGRDREGRAVFSTYSVPSYFPEADKHLHALLPPGSRVTLAGFWHERVAPARWAMSSPIREFRTQFLTSFVTAAR